MIGSCDENALWNARVQAEQRQCNPQLLVEPLLNNCFSIVYVSCNKIHSSTRHRYRPQHVWSAVQAVNWLLVCIECALLLLQSIDSHVNLPAKLLELLYLQAVLAVTASCSWRCCATAAAYATSSSYSRLAGCPQSTTPSPQRRAR